jgi:diaminopimelate decarboxylase
MLLMKSFYTEEIGFFAGLSPQSLIEKYGSPLYVYSESILRERCREMTSLIRYKDYKANYSIKANSNLALLRIILEEGLNADAVSPGEIHLLLEAGFKPSQILYISSNMSKEEMLYAINKGITISADSISQLKLLATLNPGGSIAVRINPGIGTGHHKKVVTGGNNTKFGINIDLIPEIIKIAKEANVRIKGINHHIGSLFMEPNSYVKSAENILEVATDFEGLEFIDFGGGFGIPYRKQEGQSRLDVSALGEQLTAMINGWTEQNAVYPAFMTEPGRYVVAECGLILGMVNAIKVSHGKKYIGTDIGFNVLARPVMYGSHHDIEIYREGRLVKDDVSSKTTVVGNICESGDIIAEDRELPHVMEGDIIGIMDAGAYGYSMASNYNCRLKPAEILIDLKGNDTLIRKRDSFEDIFSGFNVK